MTSQTLSSLTFDEWWNLTFSNGLEDTIVGCAYKTIVREAILSTNSLGFEGWWSRCISHAFKDSNVEKVFKEIAEFACNSIEQY